MDDPLPQTPAAQAAQPVRTSARAQRLKAALRANLKRRKEAARPLDGPGDVPGDGPGDGNDGNAGDR
jgi:hypothetical protein